MNTKQLFVLDKKTWNHLTVRKIELLLLHCDTTNSVKINSVELN